LTSVLSIKGIQGDHERRRLVTLSKRIGWKTSPRQKSPTANPIMASVTSTLNSQTRFSPPLSPDAITPPPPKD